MDKKTQIPQLPQCAVSSRTFFDDIERHFELLDNPVYADAVNLIAEGKKLYLEIEVVNSEMTFWLYRWLYGLGKDLAPNTPFGCRLKAIHFEKPSNDELKKKLLELVDTL